MIKQYNVTVNGTTYEVTVESAGGIYQLGSDPGSVQRAEKDKCLRK